jgi:hypothetical protein
MGAALCRPQPAPSASTVATGWRSATAYWLRSACVGQRVASPVVVGNIQSTSQPSRPAQVRGAQVRGGWYSTGGYEGTPLSRTAYSATCTLQYSYVALRHVECDSWSVLPVSRVASPAASPRPGSWNVRCRAGCARRVLRRCRAGGGTQTLQMAAVVIPRPSVVRQ